MVNLFRVGLGALDEIQLISLRRGIQVFGLNHGNAQYWMLSLDEDASIMLANYERTFKYLVESLQVHFKQKECRKWVKMHHNPLMWL